MSAIYDDDPIAALMTAIALAEAAVKLMNTPFYEAYQRTNGPINPLDVAQEFVDWAKRDLDHRTS
jgi:hypothetical protein